MAGPEGTDEAEGPATGAGPHEISIHEAKTHLSGLVQRAQAGEEIVIRRGRLPMAKLVRYEASQVRQSPGRLRGQIEFTPDFDYDMSDELVDLFGLPP